MFMISNHKAFLMLVYMNVDTIHIHILHVDVYVFMYFLIAGPFILGEYPFCICNGSSPPLANIILFGFCLSGMRMLGRDFHILIKNASFSSQPIWNLTIHPPFGAQRPRYYSFPPPIDVGPPNPPPFRAQRPCRYIASCPPPFGV